MNQIQRELYDCRTKAFNKEFPVGTRVLCSLFGKKVITTVEAPAFFVNIFIKVKVACYDTPVVITVIHKHIAVELMEVVELGEKIVKDAQQVLCDYLHPDGISKDETINRLQGLLDGQEQRTYIAALNRVKAKATILTWEA